MRLLEERAGRKQLEEQREVARCGLLLHPRVRFDQILQRDEAGADLLHVALPRRRARRGLARGALVRVAADRLDARRHRRCCVAREHVVRPECFVRFVDGGVNKYVRGERVKL